MTEGFNPSSSPKSYCVCPYFIKQDHVKDHVSLHEERQSPQLWALVPNKVLLSPDQISQQNLRAGQGRVAF